MKAKKAKMRKKYSLKQRRMVADIICDLCYFISMIAGIGIYGLINALDCDIISLTETLIYCTICLIIAAISINIGKTMEIISDALTEAIRIKQKRTRKINAKRVYQKPKKYYTDCDEYDYAHTV